MDCCNIFLQQVQRSQLAQDGIGRLLLSIGLLLYRQLAANNMVTWSLWGGRANWLIKVKFNSFFWRRIAHCYYWTCLFSLCNFGAMWWLFNVCPSCGQWWIEGVRSSEKVTDRRGLAPSDYTLLKGNCSHLLSKIGVWHFMSECYRSKECLDLPHGKKVSLEF